MADISKGPVQSLPGTAVPPPEGQWCDWHADRVAVVRIQGETTSVGCEWHDCCAECCNRVLFSVQRFYPGQCQLCQLFKDNLQKWREPLQGVVGPALDACQECIEARSASADAESLSLDDETTRNEVAEMIEEFDEPEEDPDAAIDAQVFGDDEPDPDTTEEHTSD